MFENVRAVEARTPFGPIWRFRAVLENTPGVQSAYRAAITKLGGSTFGRLIRNLGILAAYLAAISEAGDEEKLAFLESSAAWALA